MPELRWALIGLGLLFLAGLALWEWRRSRRQYAPHARAEPAAVIEPMERARRIESGMEAMAGLSAAEPDEFLEVPTIHPVEAVRVGVAAESAVDVPSAARYETQAGPKPVPVLASVEIQWPPRNAGQVLSLRVVNPRGEAMSGRALRIAVEAAGLRHGPQKIYHQVTADGAVLVSVANLLRPGNFEPALMDAQEFRGLSLFSVLPGVLPPVRMLDELVALARSLAQRLSATVQDEQGAELDAQRLAELRQSLPEGDA
ncbi:MAG: cell division protein ZipA C-terminal FtsZ-binding domain-containing protein [Steroidobacteraceae bacterium]